MNVSVLTGLVFLFGTVPGIAADVPELPDIDRIHSVLKKAYPEYSVLQWPNEMRGYRESPEHFVDDVLFGDFNFDGAVDFSAMLTRAPTQDELATMPKHSRERIKIVGLTVVCDGVIGDAHDKEFRCTELTKEKLGGYYMWLDFVEWTRWIDDLIVDEYNNPNCPTQLTAHAGKKLLSMVQPIGHCDAFLYPITNGGYGRCEYCAD